MYRNMTNVRIHRKHIFQCFYIFSGGIKLFQLLFSSFSLYHLADDIFVRGKLHLGNSAFADFIIKPSGTYRSFDSAQRVIGNKTNHTPQCRLGNDALGIVRVCKILGKNNIFISLKGMFPIKKRKTCDGYVLLFHCNSPLPICYFCNNTTKNRKKSIYKPCSMQSKTHNEKDVLYRYGGRFRKKQKE